MNAEQDIEEIDRFLTQRWATVSARPTSFGLAVLYILFAVAHVLLLTGGMRLAMTAIAVTSAAVLMVMSRYAGRLRPGPEVHTFMAAIALIAVANSVAHLSLSRQAYQTTNLILVAIAAAALIFSARWVAGTLGPAIRSVVGCCVAFAQRTCLEPDGLRPVYGQRARRRDLVGPQQTHEIAG